MEEQEQPIIEQDNQEEFIVSFEARLTEGYKLRAAGAKIQKLEEKLQTANEQLDAYATLCKEQRRQIIDLTNRLEVMTANNRKLKNKIGNLKNILN